MHTTYVFIIGRPCSGKSTVRRLLIEALKVKKPAVTILELDDFYRLRKIFEEDTGFERHVPTSDRGVKVIDPGIWTDLDAYLIDELTRSHPAGACIFVELARRTYLPFFSAIPPDVASNTLLVYVDCSVDAAWKRNERRKASAPLRYISKEEMLSTFAEDDFNELKNWAGERLVTVDNEADEAALKKSALEIVSERILPLLQGSRS